MQVICAVSPSSPGALSSADPELLASESELVKKLYSSGVVRQVWMRSDGKGAVLMLEVASSDEAAAVLDSLPLVEHGLLRVEAIYPLAPYPAFANAH